jgi:hypothetical protein
MEEIAELRAELAALRHLVEDGMLAHRVMLGACIGGFLAGCAFGLWAG